MKTLLLHVPTDAHAKLKRTAADAGTTMTALVIKLINTLETGQPAPDTFTAAAPMPPINTSQDVYTHHELEMAGHLLKVMARNRESTIKSLHKLIKPEIPDTLNRLIQVCIQDGYLKYIADTQVIKFIKTP